MSIKTDNLAFLDIANYLSPCSYSQYLKAFKVAEQKGYFPYEYVRSYEHLLNTVELPAYECFYSELNESNSLDAHDEDNTPEQNQLAGRQNWNKLKELWREKEMTNLLDLLEWYNNLDVTSFVQAVIKQLHLFWTHFGVDLFKEAISLPGVSLKYCMGLTDATFALYGKNDSWLYKELRESVVGGPSLIFSRYHEKGVTKLRPYELGVQAETCQAVVGVDANSLYLGSWAKDFPCGDYQVRVAPLFRVEARPTHGYSAVSIRWLESESQKRGCVKIAHKLNSGEIPIGARKLKVDGFLAEENLIFEFLGCYYHGCPECYAHKWHEIHPYYDKTFEELHREGLERIAYFKQLGYNVITQWECKYCEQINVPKRAPISGSLTETRILDMVKTGQLFGLVNCDIMTPDRLKPKLAEFPPLFKNADVSKEMIGPFMRDYCEKNGKLKKPTRLLISSYKQDNVLLITPLLRYYLEQGLVVTKIHYTVHFPEHKPCFKVFADKVTDARRRGDLDPESDILANSFKLIGNSAYGRVTMDKRKQTHTHFVSANHATKLINETRFRACRPVGGDIYEIEMYKRKHVFDLPLHLGVFTYQYAKLRMLEWHYDFMQKYLPKPMYQLAEMDTDSSYFALARSTIEECVPEHLKRQFYENYDEWFPAKACPIHKQDFVEAKLNNLTWTPSRCCEAVSAYSRRTPGLFKIEFSGDGIVALCSKTYICFGGKETKVSCKGVQKKRNMERLTKKNYLDVLRLQRSGYGINKGFRAINGKIFSYAQKRYGISYMYCKRKVLPDGINTEPLDL